MLASVVGYGEQDTYMKNQAVQNMVSPIPNPNSEFSDWSVSMCTIIGPIRRIQD